MDPTKNLIDDLPEPILMEIMGQTSMEYALVCKKLREILSIPQVTASTLISSGSEIDAWRRAIFRSEVLVEALLRNPTHRAGKDRLDSIGIGPLEYAIIKGKARAVELLVGAGVDADRVNKAFMKAVQMGRVEVLEILIDGGADVNFAEGTKRFTPLMVACINGRAACAKKLIDAGAEVDQLDENGHAALHYCRANVIWDTCFLPLYEKLTYPLAYLIKNKLKKNVGIVPFF